MGEAARRRAGLDYWHLVDCVEHESWDAFVATERLEPGDARVWLFTTRGRRRTGTPTPCRRLLLFGCETTGAPAVVREWAGAGRSATLPMIDDPGARSLNLGNAVCAAVYEGLRQLAAA